MAGQRHLTPAIFMKAVDEARYSIFAASTKNEEFRAYAALKIIEATLISNPMIVEKLVIALNLETQK